MDEAMIRKRCEELTRRWYQVPASYAYKHQPFIECVYRAAYADGQRDEMERAAKVNETHAFLLGNDRWKERNALLEAAKTIRQAVGEVTGG